MTKIARAICAILIGTVLLGGGAQAQPFPNRPIRIW